MMHLMVLKGLYFSKPIVFCIAGNVVKVIPSRCASHNAFKCTGECGFDDCNTHFMEQDALQEHIKRGREKKLSLTSSCSQVPLCIALFPIHMYIYGSFEDYCGKGTCRI